MSKWTVIIKGAALAALLVAALALFSAVRIGIAPQVDAAVSGTFSTTVTASGGGGVGVPAPAAVAGFTTLAAHYDFTQTLPSNWIDCIPSDGAAHEFYFGAQSYFRNDIAAQNPPCSSVSQATDPLTGGTALKFAWLPSYASFLNDCYFCSGVGISLNNNAGTRYTTFPANSYVRIRYRHTPTQVGSYWGFYDPMWVFNGTTLNTNAGVEYDDIEDYGSSLVGAYDSAIHVNGTPGDGGYVWVGACTSESNYVCTGGPHLGAGYDPTQYHTYDLMTTSDGSTGITSCSFIDVPTAGTPAFIACVNFYGAASTQYHQSNIWSFGGECQINGLGQCYTIPAVEEDAWVTDIEVWTCPGWTSGSYCNGSTFVNGGGSTPSYWH